MRRGDDDLQREVQVADHALDDGGLLPVLRAEHRDVGQDDVEELGNDSSHAAKVSRTRTTFHLARQLFLDDPRAEPIAVAGRIHLGIGRDENDVHARLTAEQGVLPQVARVFAEIFLRPELRRIDVDTHDDAALRPDELPRAADEAEVAFVQIAHRRDKADAPAFALPLPRQPLH